MARTFGVIEGNSFTAVVAATDRATKSANVRLVKYEKVGEHAICTMIAGEAGDIRLALEAAKISDTDNPNDQVTTALLSSLRGSVRKVLGLRR